MSKIEVKSNFDSKSLLEMGRVKGHVGYYDGMSPLCRCLKRFFDVLGSLLGMIVFSPFYLIISLMIWNGGSWAGTVPAGTGGIRWTDICPL